MVLFWPIQQELDCINTNGDILGKIKFDASTDKHFFCPLDESVSLSSEEEMSIAQRLAGLDSGQHVIAMQDDD